MRCPGCNKRIPEDEDICPYCEEEPECEFEGFTILEESRAKAESEDSEEDGYKGSSIEAADKTIEKILKKNPYFNVVKRDELEIDNGYEFVYEIEDGETGKALKILVEVNDGTVLEPKGYYTLDTSGEEDQFVFFKASKKSGRQSK